MENIKGIIALTSWKARIKGVGFTIFSILKHCKGFKVVLTLSDEEFPRKEAELPADLQALAKSGVVQILWVHKNYKPYKKIIFAMKAYPDLPIISADDDCLYKYDYAGELYNKWKQNPGCIIAQTVGDGIPWGYATLHPPGAYNPYVFAAIADYCLSRQSYHDDLLYHLYAKRKGIRILSMFHEVPHVVQFHNGACGLVNERLKHHNDWRVMNEAFAKFFG